MVEKRYRDPTKQYHSITKDEPFEALQILAPQKLETTEDYAQLMQHMVSAFRLSLNIYYKKHGYEARQQLLIMMVLLLSSIMPENNPELITGYPDSMDDIYALVGSFLLMAGGSDFEKKAG